MTESEAVAVPPAGRVFTVVSCPRTTSTAPLSELTAPGGLEALGSLRGGVCSQPPERSTSRCGDPLLGSGAVVRVLRTDHLWPWAPPHSHLRGRMWTL